MASATRHNYRYKVGTLVEYRKGKTGIIRARKVQDGRVLYEVSTYKGRMWFFASELKLP